MPPQSPQPSMPQVPQTGIPQQPIQPQVVNPQPQQQPNPQNSQLGLSPAHNAVYEKLRQVLMGLHQQGVPGIDSVLNALNQQHVKLAGGVQQANQFKTNSRPTPPASPQSPTPSGYYSGQ